MQPRISAFIVALIIFMMILAGGIGGLIAQIGTKYNPEGYDSERLEKYDRISEISQNTEDLKTESLALRSKSGVTDILGGFFESAYNALKISVYSFDIFQDMTTSAIDDTNIDRAEVYKTGIITIVLITLILGVIIAATIKWVI